MTGAAYLESIRAEERTAHVAARRVVLRAIAGKVALIRDQCRLGGRDQLAQLCGVPDQPLAGPAGLIPLPSKWHIAFGAPIETADYDESAADDPMVTFELTDQVRETIQQTLYQLLGMRSNTFLG